MGPTKSAHGKKTPVRNRNEQNKKIISKYTEPVNVHSLIFYYTNACMWYDSRKLRTKKICSFLFAKRNNTDRLRADKHLFRFDRRGQQQQRSSSRNNKISKYLCQQIYDILRAVRRAKYSTKRCDHVRKQRDKKSYSSLRRKEQTGKKKLLK